MMRKTSMALVLGLLFLIMSAAAAWAEAPRMKKEELKALLGKPNVVVIDVRRAGDWKKAGAKIKGAMRYKGEPKDWAGDLDKSKTYVLYCS